MDKRQDLFQALQNHQPHDDKEKTDLQAMLALLGSGQSCFVRSDPWAHFTGSAVLLNRMRDKVLLNHHKALNFWLQFGGHADGNPDLLDVAGRELQEESGFTAFEPAIEGILDIDVHPIPYNAARGEPAHLHYDVRYLFCLTGDDERFTISEESLDMRWCGYRDALDLTGPGSVARMLKKWHSLYAQ